MKTQTDFSRGSFNLAYPVSFSDAEDRGLWIPSVFIPQSYMNAARQIAGSDVSAEALVRQGCRVTGLRIDEGSDPFRLTIEAQTGRGEAFTASVAFGSEDQRTAWVETMHEAMYA